MIEDRLFLLAASLLYCSLMTNDGRELLSRTGLGGLSDWTNTAMEKFILVVFWTGSIQQWRS
jgi:hypothetical protein